MMESAVQQYHDELFSRHRAPDVNARSSQIKERTNQVIREIEEELKLLTHQRVAEIRSLASTVNSHEKELHQAVQTFKNHAQGIHTRISSDRDDVNFRIQKFRTEMEERKKRMMEASRQRHQQLEVEIGQIVDAARKELSNNNNNSNGDACNNANNNNNSNQFQQNQQPQFSWKLF